MIAPLAPSWVHIQKCPSPTTEPRWPLTIAVRGADAPAPAAAFISPVLANVARRWLNPRIPCTPFARGAPRPRDDCLCSHIAHAQGDLYAVVCLPPFAELCFVDALGVGSGDARWLCRATLCYTRVQDSDVAAVRGTTRTQVGGACTQAIVHRVTNRDSTPLHATMRPRKVTSFSSRKPAVNFV